MNHPLHLRRLLPLFATLVAFAGNLALAAPKIQLNRTEVHYGKIYTAPDPLEHHIRFVGPLEQLLITNSGDELLKVYVGGSGVINVPPGETKSSAVYLNDYRPKMGLQTWMTVVNSNDPTTPTINIPTSYEGIAQPPLVVEKLDGTPFVSGETVLQLDPVVLDPLSNHPTPFPRKTSVMIRARNTGVAHMQIHANTGGNWNYGINVQGDSWIELGGGITPDSFSYDTLLIPPMGTVDIEVILHPESLGPIKSKIALSSYWNIRSYQRLPSVEFFVQTVATGIPRLAVEHGEHSWDPSGIPPVEFENRYIGGSDDSHVFILNQGKLPLTVNAEITGGNQEDFFLWNQFPITIPAGGRTSAAIRFTAKDGGPRASTLRITSDDPDQPLFDVALQGNGFRLVLDDPEGTDYGDVPVGAVTSRMFTLENKGLTRISGIAADLTSTAGGQFTVVGDIPYFLDPGESSQFEVRFAPSQVGAKFSNLKVTTLENLTEPLLLAISGTGAPAASLVLTSERGQVTTPGVTTMEVPYDSVDIGDYKRFAFELKNDGDIPLTVSSIFEDGSSGDFSLLAPLPAAVAPAGRVRFEITFRPTDSGEKLAVFQIQSNDPDQPLVSIALSGSGFPFAVESPEGTEFGSTEVGETELLTFVMVNQGSDPLTGISAILTGDVTSGLIAAKSAIGPEFSLASAIPNTLAPKQRLAFKVNFRPKSPGARSIRLLLKSAENPNDPLEFKLSGKGVLAPEIMVRNARGDSLKSEVSTEKLGKVATGILIEREFSIKNTGTAALSISRITVGGPQSSIFKIVGGSPNKPIVPGRSLKFRVLCKPQKEGAFSANIRILCNDKDEKAFSFQIKGQGVFLPEIAVSRGGKPIESGALGILPRPTQKTGPSTTSQFIITNTGKAPLAKLGAKLKGSAEFKLVGVMPKNLAPGADFKLTVSYTPASSKAGSAVLVIASNDADESSFTIQLRGTAHTAKPKATRSDGRTRDLIITGADSTKPDPRTLRSTTMSDGMKYRTVTLIGAPPVGFKALVEVSSDRVNWQSGTRHTVVLISSPTLLKVRDATPVSAEAKRYIRVRHIADKL